MQEGVDYLLFNLLILGSITDPEGHVWTRSPTDLYVIETMPLMQKDSSRMAVCLTLYLFMIFLYLHLIAIVICPIAVA